MRIVYIADTRAIGGAERYLATLAEEAAGSGHEILLLAPQEELVTWLGREAPSARAARAFGDAYHDTSTPVRRGAALLALAPRLARSLRRLAPDVVHVNNGGFPGSDLCRIALPAARLAGVPRRMMTVHSNPWPRERLADPRIQAAADRLVWSSTSVVISPSKAVAEGLSARRGMPAGMGRTIYYGVASARHDPEAAARLRMRLAPAGELLVGMVSARPVAEKGYGVFLDALATAGDGVRGVLVGRPPDDLPERARAAGAQERLAIEGPRANMGDYYAACDVLAVPSTAEECMPLVILEAASVGTPAFGSRLSGIPEAIEEGIGGCLFEPGAGRELAELIRWAARDRARIVAMGRAARGRWRDRFQLETMVRATLALYAGMLGTLPLRDDGLPPCEGMPGTCSDDDSADASPEGGPPGTR
jgi:glycosyltransferase involved in cell wall biosynthesis